MMARAAGMGVGAELSSSAAKTSLVLPSVASRALDGGNAFPRAQYRPLQLPMLLAANLRSPSGWSGDSSRFSCLAPSALYCPSNFPTPLNSSAYRSSGYLQLGLSVLQRSTRHDRQQRVCGVARDMAAESGNDLELWIKETNFKEPVVVYSKTYCPYCMRVKKLLGSLGYDIEVVELDQGGRPGLQDALERVSGQYTVPNVFIGGKHIGGCDDTVALQSRGQLEPLLQAAGANKK